MRDPKTVTFKMKGGRMSDFKKRFFGVSKFLFCLLFFSFSVVMTLPAQEHLATLEGVVTEELGSTLYGVRILVTNEKTGVTYTGLSDDVGHFIIFGINPGVVTVEAQLEGFETKAIKGVELNVGSRKTLDIIMKIGEIAESITVTATVPIIEVTKSEISGVVDRNAIENMPLLDRDFTDLTTTKPGAIAGPAGLVSNALPRGTNEMLIDGVSNEEAVNNFTKINMPADAIQEFKVIINQFASEYGNASGIIQSAITRSGTNDIQGNISYYRRDEMFDDANYFVKHDGYKGEKVDYEKPEFSLNRFSGTLGGPIIKNKAHFFLAYEGVLQTTYDTVNTPLEPDQGQFSREVKNHTFFVKFNYQLNTKNLFALRMLVNPLREPNAVGGGGLQTLSTLVDYNIDAIDFNLNWTLFPSSNSINELRLLYSRSKWEFVPKEPGSYRIWRPSAIYGKSAWYPQDSLDLRYELTDNFTLFANNHTIKAGFTYSKSPQSATVDQYNPGYFEFWTDAPFDATNPATYPYIFVRSVGDPYFELDCMMYGIFIQDSWRAAKNLTLNIGLRYNGGSVEGLDIKTFDIKHFNPRLAFSWDPFGDGRTAIRGGWGTFTANMAANAGFLGGVQNNWKQELIFSPNYPDWQEDNPFWTLPRSAYVVQAYGPYTTYWSAQKDAVMPYSSQFTLGMQREIFNNMSLSVDLIYTKSYNNDRIERTNGVKAGTFDPTIPSKGQRDDMTRGDVMVVTDKGTSEYQALQISLSKRMSNNWALDLNYLLSSSKGHVEAENNIQVHNDDPNWDKQYGYMSYDARHRISLSGIWQLPLGFQVAAIMQYRSKTPWNAIYAYDFNLDSISGDYVDEHRNSRRGFDFFQLNVRISKFFNFGPRFQVQLLGEIYNLTNRNNFTNIFNRIGSPLFGTPLEAFDPRLVQLGVRINFL